MGSISTEEQGALREPPKSLSDFLGNPYRRKLTEGVHRRTSRCFRGATKLFKVNSSQTSPWGQLTQKNKAHRKLGALAYLAYAKVIIEEQRSYSKLIPLKPHIGLQLTQKFKAYRSTPDEGYLCDSQGRVRGTTQNFKVNLVQMNYLVVVC